MTQLTVKQAKALTIGYDKNSIRWYTQNIDIKDGFAVWSDAQILFKTKLKTESKNGQMKIEDIKKNAAIAKIEKREAITATLMQDCQKYPPYEAAFPKEVKQKVIYSVHYLTQALKFLKESGNEYVELNIENLNRPLLLNGLDMREKQPTGDMALIVPVRF